MTTTKLEFHNAGFVDLLNAPGVIAELDKIAGRIAAAAGDGMTIDAAVAGRHRARAQVFTETPEAKIAEATDRALTRAIEAGRR